MHKDWVRETDGEVVNCQLARYWTGHEAHDGSERGRAERMSGTSLNGERWVIFERLLEDAPRQTSALVALVWLTQVWPDESERGVLVDEAWRALPDEIAAGAFGWALELLDAAELLASTYDHALHSSARAHLLAMLVWLWRVGGERIERCALEFVDGVIWPERFALLHPRRKSANDITSVRLELLAGEFTLTPLTSHEPGHWIARASVAPSRPGALFRTYSGEQTLHFLQNLGWALDAPRGIDHLMPGET